MNIIKYFSKKGWTPLYANIIAKCLFADKNLSDVQDKEEARKNLELDGDNNHTHYHDDRYLPLIQEAEDRVMNVINNMKQEIEDTDMVSTITGDISTIINLKSGWYKWTGMIDSIEATWIIVKANTLYTAINMGDPRIVLRSNDLSSWVSPYAYWHV